MEVGDWTGPINGYCFAVGLLLINGTGQAGIAFYLHVTAP